MRDLYSRINPDERWIAYGFRPRQGKEGFVCAGYTGAG